MSSSGSEYVSKNKSTATTEAYMDPHPDSDQLSPGSSHGTVADFLEQNTCPLCETAPAFEIARFLAHNRLVGPEKCLIIDPENVAHIFCHDFESFFHVECITRHHVHMDICQGSNSAVNYLKNLVNDTYHCYKCQVNSVMNLSSYVR